MGCDIHPEVDVKRNGRWVSETIMKPSERPFSHRDYAIFAFLADVRNTFGAPIIQAPRGRTPARVFKDVRERAWVTEEPDPYKHRHSFSWVLLSELLNYDYDKTFVNQQTGKTETLRDFLSPYYFQELAVLTKRYSDISTDDVRLFFSFDS